MDFSVKYGRLIAGFIISTAVVFGSMNVWILTILSPILVFLIFKVLKVWRTKERAIYGVPAIILGVLLFFLAFSYHVGAVPQGNFENESLKAVIEPYSTSNMSAVFKVKATYNGTTQENLSYVVKNIDSGTVFQRGSVNGTVRGNSTLYKFNLSLPRGIYNVTIHVGNATLSISAVKESPLGLFERYLMGPGLYLSLLLSSLYMLFIIGIQIMRKGQVWGMRHAQK